MKKQIIERAYWRLRARFERELDRSSWIWKDFFEDQEAGLLYFTEQVESDKDFEWLNSVDEDTTIEKEYSDDVADDVYYKLSKSDFIHSCQQASQ